MISFEKNGSCKYAQLKNHLISELRSGKFKAGDAFHTERELMGMYKLSYATVSRAVKELKQEGFFSRVRGHGTFVTETGALPASQKIMDEPLCYIRSDIRKITGQSPDSFFLHDEIQRGVLNTYNGSVKIYSHEEFDDFFPRAENFRAVIYNPAPDMLAKMRSSGHVVAVNHKRLKEPVFRFNSVSWEMLLGTYELMSYFIRDLGHSKIAYIGGDREEYHTDRHAGYQIGLKSYGIEERNDYIIRGLRGSEEDGHNAMRKLLALPDPPTAVFADTDVKALGAIKAAQEAGLRVPEDISVAGFDDKPGSEDFNPPLTTVKIPYYDMGRRAVEMLMERINNSGGDIPSETLKSSLLIRASCGKTRKL
jgi:DNA-binding transcriptional regulator YhcF (GntR family)